MKQLIFFSLLVLFETGLFSQSIRPVPTDEQQAWHDMEFYLFMHFGPNTFTAKEWGLGNEPENVFDPKELDCRQWCRIAKEAGAKGIIITAKHHDGFCLWPSKFSTHTVKQSTWKNGEGDVLNELSLACKSYGLKFGVYLSPWDRNHPSYGTPAYNNVFVSMLKEIFSNYGPIWELWWDGANGEGPNGKKQVYDWKLFEKTVRELSPKTVIFSDVGPDIRWVGNEEGIAGVTNWNYLDTAGFKRGEGAPPTDTLNQGNVVGAKWIPAECDVSIRPGWFYHQEENSKVKTPEQLFELYLKSVGRGANLLLNVPPDRRGLISKYDSASLIEFKKLRDRSFSGGFITNLRKGITKFNKPVQINCIVIKEALRSGQHCKKFSVLFRDEHNTVLKNISYTTIGHKRIITFPKIKTSSTEFKIDDQTGQTGIAEMKAYLINEKLIVK